VCGSLVVFSEVRQENQLCSWNSTSITSFFIY